MWVLWISLVAWNLLQLKSSNYWPHKFGHCLDFKHCILYRKAQIHWLHFSLSTKLEKFPLRKLNDIQWYNTFFEDDSLGINHLLTQMEKKKIGSSVVQLQLGRTLIHTQCFASSVTMQKSFQSPNQINVKISI